MRNQITADFLRRFSIEITAGQADKLDMIASRLEPGTRVYIALISPEDGPGQVAVARGLRERGMEPVPHLPARYIPDAAALEERLQMLTGEAGVKQVLALGGGTDTPAGDFHSVMGLLETGLFDRHGISSFGFAGHPEGNADITRRCGEEALEEALRWKADFAERTDARAWLVTQFVFEAAPVVKWIKALRTAGINLPVHVGIAGPATIKTLLRYALMCGVGASVKVVRRQARQVTKLLSVSAPDALVEELAGLWKKDPSGVVQPHFFPLGGFERTMDWLAPKAGEGVGAEK